MARYLALTDGCIGTRYIRAGEEFEYDGPAPRWARAEEEPKPAEQKPAKKTASGGKKAGK